VGSARSDHRWSATRSAGPLLRSAHMAILTSTFAGYEGDFSTPEVGRIAVGERITSRHAELDGHCASGDEEPLDLVWISASLYRRSIDRGQVHGLIISPRPLGRRGGRWRRPRPGCPRRAWQGRWTHGCLRRSVLASGHGPSGGASPPLRCRGCSRPCPQPRARPASSVNRSLR
jgi:hypothetical protein